MNKLSIAATIVLCTATKAFADDCEKLIQFDTEYITKDYAAQYVVINRINAENYDENKKKLEGSFLDIFSGSYSDFQKKREVFNSYYKSVDTKTLSEKYFSHVLSPIGAEAYTTCIAENSNKLITAWISTKHQEEKIAVTVKTGASGDSKVRFQISGEKTKDKPVVLTSGSRQTLNFTHDTKLPFVLTINAVNLNTKQSDSTVVELPARKEYALKAETINIDKTMRVGCGCHGSQDGCMGASSNPATFVAPEGFSIDPTTLDEVSHTVNPPGIESYTKVQNETKDADDKIVRLELIPATCWGMSNHSAGSLDILYRVRATKRYLTEK